ncbi:hypothetical protein [Anaeromyxobacter paludicola]|uniref:Cytochrome c family protein n=1 Tax=Anaeromyxobacter paludicola TaxID=2918171 RepID=A0ABN6ND69_9BACT|nr:hypothetical protein [Anaeromyxobacter paludicola]BDG09952.1 hypothetical protein AMPC_30650 [Anaeromyxobacter paludicola]
MASSRLPLLALLAAALAAPAPAARADVFSPGPLSRAHEKLEGLQQCTKCHVVKGQLSAARCLECHQELAGRVKQGRGLHGRLPAADREACNRCHLEHQGRDFALVDWGGPKERFDHARTGYRLEGKHAAARCDGCHAPARIADPGVKQLLAREPGRRTFLGAPQACASCHFDEHRGQLSQDCQKCHGLQGWKPASLFAHDRTGYPLEGKHRPVACAKCHKVEREPARDPGALTRPASPEAFTRYRPVAHGGCQDCHKDPHQARFGQDCQRCHAPALAWTEVRATAKERAFHQKTRYPLQGAHETVACQACHGPFAGQPARFRGLAFQACRDCHLDAHVGQLTGGSRAGACERCHTVQGWQPARFDLEDHTTSRYALQGAHRTVACSLCHVHDPRLADRVPAEARARLAREKRPARVSPALFSLGPSQRCEQCHADPHAGQFPERMARESCAACHEQQSFLPARFDHQKDSRFPLTGKHGKAACASCHAPGAAGAVRYKPLETACAACHRDPHAGQLAVNGRDDCARCHDTRDWKQTSFQHAPPFTTFLLQGKHARAKCEACHAPVAVGGGAPVRRYRGLPRTCEGCHADFHQGAFRGFTP